MNAETRNRIEALMGDYAAAIDDDRLEEWPDMFVDDCRYVVTSRQNHLEGLPHGTIYATSKGMLTDRVSALRDANIYEAQSYRHIVGSIQILGVDNGVATVRSNFLVVRIMHNGEMILFATGCYQDKIDVSGEKAKFRERLVICDSQNFDTLLAIPL
ncbi:MAG: aromatic-ring-hydroxylating dioxygenase subunit beta [Aquisalimonadaceae bacterium]